MKLAIHISDFRSQARLAGVKQFGSECHLHRAGPTSLALFEVAPQSSQPISGVQFESAEENKAKGGRILQRNKDIVGNAHAIHLSISKHPIKTLLKETEAMPC